MKITLINVFDKIVLPNSNFKTAYGNAFLIKSEKQHILYDMGSEGKLLLHNLNLMNISPNAIDILILSHGHVDHTNGLKEFLSERTTDKPLITFLHPNALELKKFHLLLRGFYFLFTKTTHIGFPKLSNEMKKKIEFKFVREPYQVTSCLFTVGEVNNRSEKDGTSGLMVHMEEGKWKKDPLIDDLSIVLDTKDGLVLICGCCHAGILNTCNKIKRTWPEKRILTIIGGTHMMSFSKKELAHISDVLENEHNAPKLYLNHCTGKRTISYLKKRLGSEIVQPFNIGSELTFECN